MKLNERQKAFADYFIETGNATESAIRAGYSKKTARAIASENLSKPYIAEYIKARNDALSDARIADMTEVKQFWTTTMRDAESDPKDRIKVSELIAKTNGAFLDRVEHSGVVEVNPMKDLTADELRMLIEK